MTTPIAPSHSDLKRLFSLLLAGAAFLSPSGCGMVKKPSPLSAQEAAIQSYVLRVGDEVEIADGANWEKALKAPIQEDGTVLYPGVGNLPAAGRSLKQVESDIEEALIAAAAAAADRKAQAERAIEEEEEKAIVDAPPGIEVITPAQALDHIYRLQTGDQLDISVWEHTELSVKAQLRADGTFPYPLLGSIPGAGRTTADLEKELKEKLDQDFLVNPQVTVRLTGTSYTVLGHKGETSGSHSMEGTVDLMTAISKAGDVLTLQRSPVEIIRRQGDKQVVIRAHVKHLLNGQQPNIPVLPRDMIYVKPSAPAPEEVIPIDLAIRLANAKFTALGEVNSPGTYSMEGFMDLLTAISLAGGISKFGSSNVEVIRSNGDQQVVIRANVDRILKGKDSNIPILPRDTIYARRRLF